MSRRRPQDLTRHSLREVLTGRIRHRILATMKPGDRLESEAALASALGASLGTVREVLAALATEGLIERRHGSGTFVRDHRRLPGVGISAGRIVLVAGATVYWTAFVRYLLDTLSASGYVPRLYIKSEGTAMLDSACSPALFEDLADRRLVGLISSGTNPDWRWILPIERRGVPVVTGHGGFPGGVGTDWEDIGRRGAEYLAASGCRGIALVASTAARWHGAIAPMAEGFTRALKRHGLSVNPAWIHCGVSPAARGSAWEEFRDLWLRKGRRPDGLVIADDGLFADIALAVCELGIRVPEQVRIISHWNKGSDLRSPFPVARLECDPALVAAATVDMLLKRLRGELGERAASVVVKHSLVLPDAPVDVEMGVGSRHSRIH